MAKLPPTVSDIRITSSEIDFHFNHNSHDIPHMISKISILVIDRKTKRKYHHPIVSSSYEKVSIPISEIIPSDFYTTDNRIILLDRNHTNYSIELSNYCRYKAVESITSKIYDFIFEVTTDVCEATLSTSNTDSILLIKSSITLIHGSSLDYDILLDDIHLVDTKVQFKPTTYPRQEIEKQSTTNLNYHVIHNWTIIAMISSILLLLLLLLFMILLSFISYGYSFHIPNTPIIFTRVVIININIIMIMIIIETYILFYSYQQIQHISKQSSKRLYVNGWNAWSFTGSIFQGDLPPIYALPRNYVHSFHAGTSSLDINQNSRNRLFIDKITPYIASDMFGILSYKHSKAAIVCGFLSQQKQFGYISWNYFFDHMNVHCDGDLIQMKPNITTSTDWLMIHCQDVVHDDPLAVYMDLSGYLNRKIIASNHIEMSFLLENDNTVSRKNTINTLSNISSSTVPIGWCSWYHFFTNISDHILLNNIHSMHNIRREYDIPNFNLFQIDDGYQITWGDWLTLHPKKFPYYHSMKPIIDKIIDSNFTPGLWMAPFACDIHSKVAKNHPEWILYNQDIHNRVGRKPANSANCGKWFYGFDITIPEVREYVRYNIKTAVQDWGCQYLKLDFLYVAVLRDARATFSDRSLTRAQIMQMGMHLIREAAGENIFILGCGAPIGSAIGHVQANRVSADAGLQWLPEFPLPYYDKWNLPCGRNMMRNTLCRMSMHGRWWINDPDCILLRKSTKFTDDEIIAIATSKGLCGGSIIVSDDIAMIPKDRLKVMQQILPPTNISAIPLDLLSKEMPELLRLTITHPLLIRSSSINSDSDRKVTISWNTIALCNWDERRKDQEISLSSMIKGLLPSSWNLTIDGNKSTPMKSTQRDMNKDIVIHLFDFWRGQYGYICAQYHSSTTFVTQARTHMNYTNKNININNDHSQDVLSDISIAGSELDRLSMKSIPQHGARLLSCHVQTAFTSDVDKEYRSLFYLGSNMHFSCGLEVESINEVDNTMKGLHHSYEIVFLPGYLKKRSWNGYFYVVLICDKKQFPIHNVIVSGLCISIDRSTNHRKVYDINESSIGMYGSVWSIPVFKNDGIDSNDLSVRTVQLSW